MSSAHAYQAQQVTGEFQPINVYVNTVDADYVVPADASLVIWNVPAEAANRTIDYSLVPAGQIVTLYVEDSSGFLVQEAGTTAFSLNDTSHRVQTITSNGGGTVTANTGTAAQYNVGTSGATVPLLDQANTWSANQRINAALSLNSAPVGTFNITVVGVAAGGRVGYFRSNNGADPNTALVIDAPTNFNPGFVLQENATDRFLFDYNSNSTSGNRLANTFEIYSFAAMDPVVRVHESSSPLAIWIGTAGTAIGATGTPVLIENSGLATMVAGTVAVPNTSVAASSRIQLTFGFNPTGNVYYTKNPGVGFTIDSSNAADAGEVSWSLTVV